MSRPELGLTSDLSAATVNLSGLSPVPRDSLLSLTPEAGGARTRPAITQHWLLTYLSAAPDGDPLCG